MSKILKEITAKDNRKALRKALLDTLLFLSMMFIGYYTALITAIYIWNY